jgi:hypothetical protein
MLARELEDIGQEGMPVIAHRVTCAVESDGFHGFMLQK